MDWPITYRRKIRYSDTDAQKIVFNGNYFTYIDDTLTDYVEALGEAWTELEHQGIDLVLAHIEISFRSPARLGETVVTGLRAVEVGNTSIRFAIKAWEGSSARTLVEGSAVQVTVDAKALEKRPVPAGLIAGIERLQGGPLARRAG